MKTNLRLVLLVIIGNLLFSAYQFREPIGHATIVINILDKKIEPIELSTPDVFTLQPVSLIKTENKKNGKIALTVPLHNSLFVDLQVGEYYTTLLLSPGDNIQIDLNRKLVKNPFNYLGKGSKIANYIYKSSLIWDEYEQSRGHQLMTLSPNDFVNRLYIIQKHYDRLYDKYQKKNIIPKTALRLLEQRNKMKILSCKLNYAMAQFNPDNPSKKLLPILKKAYKEVPFQANLLKVNMYEYGLALNFYAQSALLDPFVKVKDKEELISLQDRLPILVDRKIINGKYPRPVQIFLRSKNLQLFLKQQGLTSSTNFLLKDIKKEPEYTFYERSIIENYTGWQELVPGKEAPIFSGVTPGGDTLSINSLKGKVVYIDVWATWCMPCRKELPQAKQLQKHFFEDDRIVFLYISIDQDHQAWKKLLMNDPDFKGIHINQPPGKMFETFWKAYQLSGIPRYILIDQDGKLVDVNAAHPSSNKLEATIRHLLN